MSGGRKMANEESIFDAAELNENMPAEQELEAHEEVDSEEWVPSVSKESPKDRKERVGSKIKADGKILTIKNYFFTRPKTKRTDGTPIEPKKSQDGNTLYYTGKLGIRFVEDNLIEYYPSFHYFVNDGSMSKFAKVNRGGDNTITKLFKLAVAKIGKPEDQISDQEFFDFLKGKKVKIKVIEGKFQGQSWFRNDIVEIL